MNTPRRLPVLLIVLLALGVASWSLAGQAAQDAPKPPVAGAGAAQPAAAKPAVAAPAAEVTPPPMPPREKTGVYVFLAWTWLTIAVLLYILTLKVREADRVLRTGLFGTAGDGKEPPERR